MLLLLIYSEEPMRELTKFKFELSKQASTQLALLPDSLRHEITILLDCDTSKEFTQKTCVVVANLISRLKTKLLRYYGISTINFPKYCSDFLVVKAYIANVLESCNYILNGGVKNCTTVKIVDYEALYFVIDNNQFTIEETNKVVRPYMGRRIRRHLHFAPAQNFSDQAIFKFY